MLDDSIVVLLALLIPLTLDTFILSTALGLAGLPRKQRLSTSLVLALFEGIMPAVGVLLGHSVDHIIGRFAGYLAAIVIGLAGAILLRPAKEEDKELKRLKLLSKTRGLAIIYLGVSISIDELAIGFSLGLLGIPVVLAMILIATQAFIASQLGLSIGSKLGERLRDRAEKVAGALLIIIAAVLFIFKLNGHSL